MSEVLAFDKNGLRIVFSLERLKEAPTTTVVNVIATNQSQAPFTEFLFQAAVPKVSHIIYLHIRVYKLGKRSIMCY